MVNACVQAKQIKVTIVLNDLLKNWVKSADEPFLFRVIFRYFD